MTIHSAASPTLHHRICPTWKTTCQRSTVQCMNQASRTMTPSTDKTKGEKLCMACTYFVFFLLIRCCKRGIHSVMSICWVSVPATQISNNASVCCCHKGRHSPCFILLPSQLVLSPPPCRLILQCPKLYSPMRKNYYNSTFLNSHLLEYFLSTEITSVIYI